jgi:hypothetical protein
MTEKPAVVFLIPIAAPAVVRDWPLACRNFQRTLGSLFNSTNANFRVAVAGHAPPDFPLPADERFKFLTVSHPVPAREQTTWVAPVRDKMLKISAAWEFAKAVWQPRYVMKVDWDDLISARLVDWLDQEPDAAGYRVKYGWIWRPRPRGFIQQSDEFDRMCGTCLIIRSDLADQEGPFLHSSDGAKFDAASQRLEGEDKYSLIPGAATGKLLLNDSHSRAEAQFAYLGHQLQVVPFRAAIYRIGHGNNATGDYHRVSNLRMLLGRIRRLRPITSHLKREFNLG